MDPRDSGSRDNRSQRRWIPSGQWTPGTMDPGYSGSWDNGSRRRNLMFLLQIYVCYQMYKSFVCLSSTSRAKSYRTIDSRIGKSTIRVR
uniref:Uncharacterized protein n=1 Tax=Steinernema glaseri TaxID=37863 RepID=A0A1I8A1Y4_9BILA